MRKAYVVLAYLLAIEVVVQAMAVAFAIAGLGHWVEHQHGVLDKKVFDSHSAHFTGVVGFPIHGINGEMLIPLLTLVLLAVSFGAHVAGATRRALVVLGMVVLQVVLGISLDAAPALAPLHVINAFGILAMAVLAGVRARPASDSTAEPTEARATVDA